MYIFFKHNFILFLNLVVFLFYTSAPNKKYLFYRVIIMNTFAYIGLLDYYLDFNYGGKYLLSNLKNTYNIVKV